MSAADELRVGLESLGLAVDADWQARLLDYVALLQKWNHTYNLTAIHDATRIISHHLLDSLAIASHVRAARLLDVGSGAGLPGIPLALVQPERRFTLLDASQKKCAFMQQAVIQLGLGNVQVVHARAEDFRPATLFGQIVSRAFSDLTEFVRVTTHLLAEGGEWLAMKGLYPNEEIALLRGARVVRDMPLRVPGLDAERHLIVMARGA